MPHTPKAPRKHRGQWFHRHPISKCGVYGHTDTPCGQTAVIVRIEHKTGICLSHLSYFPELLQAGNQDRSTH